MSSTKKTVTCVALAALVVIAAAATRSEAALDQFKARLNLVFDNGTFMFYMGSDSGLTRGDTYVLYLEDAKAAVVELTDVAPSFSKGRVVGPTAGLVEGQYYTFVYAPGGAAASGGGAGETASTGGSGGGEETAAGGEDTGSKKKKKKKSDGSKDDEETATGGGERGAEDTAAAGDDGGKKTKKKKKKDDTASDAGADTGAETAGGDKPAGGDSSGDKPSQSFVPMTLSRGEILGIIGENKDMDYSDMTSLRFNYNYTNSRSRFNTSSSRSINSNGTLSYERTSERQGNGYWTYADLSYRKSKSSSSGFSSDTDDQWRGFLEYGYKAYAGDNSEFHYLLKGRYDRTDAVTSASNTVYVAEQSVTTVAGGIGYGKPLDVGPWRDLEDVQELLMKKNVVSGPLPMSARVAIVNLLNRASGNFVYRMEVVRGIHKVLADANLISGAAFDADVSVDLAKILDQRFQNLQEGLEIRADYAYNTVKWRTETFSDSYKGRTFELELMYKYPMSDLAQFRINPMYHSAKYKSEGFSWREKITRGDARIQYAISDTFSMEIKYDYFKAKYEAFKYTVGEFSLSFMYNIM